MNQDHKKLHEKFSALGLERNRLTYELLAMLPQIYIEGVYREHRCATIYEYAGKYAGLSHSVVEKTLKLHKELEGKPFLREAIKTEGVHKVALVARLATSETDEVLAKRVVDMSKPALQELSRELRQKVEINRATIGQAGNDETVNPRFCRAAQESMIISLDPEMQFLFLKLKKRFEKSLGVNLSNKHGLKLMLEELAATNDRSDGVSDTKQRKGNVVKNFPGEKMDGGAELLRNDMRDDAGKNAPGAEEIMQCINHVRTRVKKVDSDIFKRYIPVAIRRVVLNETEGGCAYPGCNRPYENFHHRERFANGGRHDSIVPVCGAHHEFAHNGLVVHELDGAEKWELDLLESRSRSFADRMGARKGG